MRNRYTEGESGKGRVTPDWLSALSAPIVVVLATLAANGCGGFGGAGSSSANAPAPPATPAPPAAISVSLSPPGGAVLLGSTMQFSATVTNATNSAVAWSVDGVAGGNAGNGTISSAGMYSAPQVLPPSSETIAATSVSDPTKSASASITVTSDVAVSISPGLATVQPGGTQQFSSTISSAGRPVSSVTWFVNGIAGGNTSLGTISGSGLYTAPQTPAAALNVTVTAQSVADPSKSAAAVVTVTSPPSVSVMVSPALATIGLGNTQVFSAQVSGTANTLVTWDVNGITSGNASVGTLSPGALPNSVVYGAPSSFFSGPIDVRATSAANPAASGSATISLTSGVAISLAPSIATLAINHRQRFSATIAGSATSNVNWSVGGIAGGNSALGQICAAGSDPCMPLSGNSSALSVDYLAPAAVPAVNPVQLAVTSQVDPSKSASSTITLLPHIVVSVSPPSATVAAGSITAFSASVLGTADQGVIWNIGGIPCGTPSACGAINSDGQFTAPIEAPSPNVITATATSLEDASRSGSASIAISTSPVITQILPASATAGAVGGFLVRVLGGNFVSPASSQGSQIVVAGTARATVCANAGDCSTTLAQSDLAAPANLPVLVQNPDGSTSPLVFIAVVAPSSGPSFVSLTPANPSVSGNDIFVIDSSTAGSALPSADEALSIQALGSFSALTNSCSLGGNAVALQRPASGTVVTDICAFSASGLDPAHQYWVTGPPTPDLVVIAAQSLGFGIVDLTIAVPANAQAGARTLFVQNPNKDIAAASGALEVRE
ncbi:MAG TPA: hypothetical protein VFO34_13765 [Candidatus Acidoferrales bacterium]|nr:hypothetical protein [Candidatus Acidoferrales bacterium]